MHKVSDEIHFLYDFLRQAHLVDREKGVRRLMRLLIFIDDLDRCPKDVVVKVLEAIILLLAEAPITCWLAIDSRVVATSIEDAYGTVFSKAGISGYEFLEKIIQLPCARQPRALTWPCSHAGLLDSQRPPRAQSAYPIWPTTRRPGTSTG